MNEEMQPDLFGGETRVIQSTPSGYRAFKLKNNYRKSTSNEKCGNCENHTMFKYYGKAYHKCVLLGISHSEATDIRARHVCDLWEDGEKQEAKRE